MSVLSAPIAIIGAGLAGLACADRLMQAGLEVRLFDKGRGPGGRLSTRRSDRFQFDHGCQFLTARDPDFQGRMARWLDHGVAARWTAPVVRLHPGGLVEDSPGERFVGVPGMNAPIHALAEGLPVQWGLRVAAVEPARDGWRLTAEDGRDLGCYRQVVVAVPAPQAVPLLAGAPDLASRAAMAHMAHCWAVMLAFEDRIDVAWDAAFVAAAGGEGRPLSWLARNSSKPGRPSAESWVLHAAPTWSDVHSELAPDAVLARLLPAFQALTGAMATPVHAVAHRWRYALPTAPLGDGCLWKPQAGLGACGDWCQEARAEAAWVSGRRLAQAMLAPAPEHPV